MWRNLCIECPAKRGGVCKRPLRRERAYRFNLFKALIILLKVGNVEQVFLQHVIFCSIYNV